MLACTVNGTCAENRSFSGLRPSIFSEGSGQHLVRKAAPVSLNRFLHSAQVRVYRNAKGTRAAHQGLAVSQVVGSPISAKDGGGRLRRAVQSARFRPVPFSAVGACL